MDFNQIFSNEENIYLGHGTSVDNDKVIQSIMENGLRCSHGSLYFTSVLLGVGGQILEEQQELLKNWPHNNSKTIAIVSLPRQYKIIDQVGTGTYNQGDAAFYYTPSEEQRNNNPVLTNSSYVMPEFIMGYYNASNNTFTNNPRYYENLPLEEQEKLFEQVKENYFNVVSNGWNIDEYKEIAEDLNFSFPLNDIELNLFKEKKEKNDFLSSLPPEIFNKELNLPGGNKIPAKKYIEQIVLPYFKNYEDKVELVNGAKIPFSHFIMECVIYDCQERYNGDFHAYVRDNVNLDNKQEAIETENKGEEKVSSKIEDGIESKYFSIKYRPSVNGENFDLDLKCSSLLTYFALADISRKESSIELLKNNFHICLSLCKTKEEAENFAIFLKKTSDIGGYASTFYLESIDLVNNKVEELSQINQNNNNGKVSFIADNNIKSGYLNIQDKILFKDKYIIELCNVFLNCMAVADFSREKDDIARVVRTFNLILYKCKTDEDYINFRSLLSQLASVGGYAVEFYNEHFSSINKDGTKKVVEERKARQNELIKKHLNQNQENNQQQNTNHTDTTRIEKLTDEINELIESYDQMKSRGMYSENVIWDYKRRFTSLFSDFNDLKGQIDDTEFTKTIMSLNDRLDSCDKIINALKEEQRIWAM